jgi:LmbE family N-acetylglucosaminyl deacetylase
VLSAWSVLRGAGWVGVVNVCAGSPPNGVLADWDRLTGATDSAARMAERVAEDRRALGLAGIEPRNLRYLDDQYRGGEPLPAAELELDIGRAAAGADVVHAPAGLGGHPDHVAVREAALSLAARSGVSVVLYAELPYATRFGWPGWVTGADPTPETGWERHLSAVSCGPERLRPHVRSLTEEGAAEKARALREYQTQLPALEAAGRVTRPEVSRWEVGWEVTAPSR